MSKEQDRLLTDEEDGISPYVSEDFQEAYEESILKPICKAQRDLTRAETLKEVGRVWLKGKNALVTKERGVYLFPISAKELATLEIGELPPNPLGKGER